MSRRSGPTLADRVAGTAWSEEPTGRRVVRHCWVVDAPGHPGRYAGVLLEWRRDDAGGWEAQVAYVMPEPSATRSRLVERWLPAACLEPVRA